VSQLSSAARGRKSCKRMSPAQSRWRALKGLAAVAGICVAAAGLLPGGTGHAASTPACSVGLATTLCPDLSLGRLTATVVDRGRRLELSTRVVNQGTADSTETTVQAVVGHDVVATETLAALAVKDFTPVTLRPLIPTDLRGTGQPATLTVDPAGQVPELNEDNNVARSKAYLPPLPDLTIENETTTLDASGDAVTVDGTITNTGTAADELQTTIQVSAAGSTAAAPVPPLQVGQSTSVRRTLQLPRRLVGRVQLALAVDPDDLVAEQNEDNNSYSPKPLSIAPDLAIGSIVHTRRHGTVFVQVTIRNSGNRRADETTVHASAPGWNTASAHLGAVAPLATTTIPLSLRVPRSALGHSVPIGLSVDPVAGDPPANNRRSTTVSIPTSPPVGYPDLAVSALRFQPANGALHVRAVAANIGNARATGVQLVLSGDGWPRRRRTLNVLEGGHSSTINFLYRVPKRARGHETRFTLVAAPAHGERALANNRISATVKLSPPTPTPSQPPAPNGPRWTLIGSVGGVLLGVAVGLTLVVRGRRLRLRVRWESQANSERPQTCSVPQTHVLRLDGKPKPALRKVEKLELTAAATADADERRKSVEGTIVEALNRALWAHRLHRRRRLRALTDPLGEQLATEIEQWLAEVDRREVTINAHVKGGKVECEFTRSECVRDGDSCRWEERQSWKRELEHEVDELVSTVRLPLEPRGERIRHLSAELRALVERIDIPRGVRAPEGALAHRS
jgi:CARDB